MSTENEIKIIREYVENVLNQNNKLNNIGILVEDIQNLLIIPTELPCDPFDQALLKPIAKAIIECLYPINLEKTGCYKYIICKLLKCVQLTLEWMINNGPYISGIKNNLQKLLETSKLIYNNSSHMLNITINIITHIYEEKLYEAKKNINEAIRKERISIGLNMLYKVEYNQDINIYN